VGALVRRVLPVLLLLLLVAAPAANASEPLGDLAISDVSLAVDAKGVALLTYRREDGKLRHVLAWGAIDANPPSQTVPQVAFHFDYSGGLRSRGRSVAARFRNACAPYDGPPLVFLVAACKAPDGTYWAVQAWKRLLPMRGFDPWLPEQGKLEFHLSHWSSQLADLEVSQNWTYGGRWQGLFGRLTYRGAPVYGFRTPSSTRRGDGYARYVYIDAHDSVYGPGWRHDAGKVLHVGNGAFCYSFVPQVPPPGYPSRTPRGPALGDLHRVTVLGPGVTPDVGWVGPTLGPYDPAQDAVYNALFDRLVGSADKVCTNER
jgi:hypothetical protein